VAEPLHVLQVCASLATRTQINVSTMALLLHGTRVTSCCLGLTRDVLTFSD